MYIQSEMSFYIKIIIDMKNVIYYYIMLCILYISHHNYDIRI